MDNPNPLRVFVTRGDAIESEHRAALVVADSRGKLVASAGDPHLFAYFRSSAKPFQAIPVVESGAADAFGLSESDLAFCCSSHSGEQSQLQSVAAMLENIGADQALLQCGAGLPYNAEELARVTLGLVPLSALHNNCSGKHAGMLATCLHLGYPVDSYLSLDHPLQTQILEILVEAMRRDAKSISIATDGCSLPTFGASLTDFAHAYAALAAPGKSPSSRVRSYESAIVRLRAAMVAYPENIAGKGELDSELMRLSNGKVIAKIGAEGLLCMALPKQELGIAIRISDGSYRGLNVLAIGVLEQLELVEPAEIEAMKAALQPAVTNVNGWTVGEFRSNLSLQAMRSPM